MKFKREDLGLYFTLGLVGSGAGLLVGAFVASRLLRSEPIFIPSEYSDDEWEVEFVDEDEKTLPKFSPVKKSMKKRAKKEEEDNEELEAFIEEYEPNSIQIEMIKKGLLTIPEVIEALNEERAAKLREPYNYAEPYYTSPGGMDDKPDLDELVILPDEIEVIDDRWEVSSSMTSEKSKKNLRRVYYDVEDHLFFVKTRSNQIVPMGGLEGTISDEVWDTIEPYLVSGMGPIYVNDLESPKHFVFQVTEDLEESSTSRVVD